MFDSKDFFYVDFGTTGVDPKSDRICQIGAILPDGSELFTLLILSVTFLLNPLNVMESPEW